MLAPGEVLSPEDFAFLDSPSREQSGGGSLEELVIREVVDALEGPEDLEIYREILTRVERPLIETVLERTGGNQIRAAGMLGINRNTLRKKIAELDIPVPGRA